MKLVISQYTKRQQLRNNILCVVSLRLYSILNTVAEEYVWRLNSNTMVATSSFEVTVTLCRTPLCPRLFL